MKVDYSFRCKDCSKVNLVSADISTDEIEFYNTDDTHADMLAESRDPTSITMHTESVEICYHCETEYYMYMEYNAFGIKIEIEGLDSQDISYSDVRFESTFDWLTETGMAYQNIEENVYKNFIVSIADLKSLIKKIDPNNGASTLNKMIFVQAVTSFEAYLGDTLVNTVLGSRDNIKRFLYKNKEINSQKFSLVDIFESNDLVTDQIKGYLVKQIYHNISKVNSLYKSSLGFSLPLTTVEKKSLYEAVSYRHDCVHRNGFTIEGKRLHHFEQEYLMNTCALFQGVVDKIEALLKKNDA
ncbi:TPA: hypothetical protein ACPVW4_004501 [Vibrio parahaemolyticus]